MSQEGMIPSPGGGRNPAEGTELPRATKAQQSETVAKLQAARKKIEEQLREIEAAASAERAADLLQAVVDKEVPASAGPEGPTKREPLSGQRAERFELSSTKKTEQKKAPAWGDDWAGKSSGWEKGGRQKQDPEKKESDRATGELPLDEQQRNQELLRQRAEREQSRLRHERDERRDEVVQQLLEEVDTLQKELRGGRPQKDSAFRIGNIVAKIPILASPAKNTEERLVQLADYMRGFTKYLDATLYEQTADCLEELTRRSIAAHRMWISTKSRERTGLQETEASIWHELSKEQERYFRSIAPLLEEKLDKSIQSELEDFDSEQLFGFQRVLAILMCVRRILDVRSLEDLNRIETVARSPRATEYEELRAWWVVANSAHKAGHVSVSQIAYGLTKLVENLERQQRFVHRIMRDVTTELSALGLTELGAREQIDLMQEAHRTLGLEGLSTS